MLYPCIILKKEREISLFRRHHWIFSGGIDSTQGQIEDGDIVQVKSKQGNFLALGYFCKGTSIAVKILSFENNTIDQDFWLNKIAIAYNLRKNLNLVNNTSTNCYRLINAEGDSAPGLIIDIYSDLAVIQCQTLGIYKNLKLIGTALKENVKHLKTIFFQYPATEESGYLLGESPEEQLAMENGFKFIIDHETGQKTGFFVDQRENRALVKQYAQGRTVLNAFCYTGGFSVYALAGGAKKVYSLDSSKKALDILEKNIPLNFSEANHQTICADYFNFIKNTKENFDLIILDPPAFAKSHRVLDNGIKGYRNINSQSMQSISKGGLLFTFSCSQAMTKELFQKTLFEAALQAKREVKILYQLHQSPCHPINIYHPEGEYLKGLVLEIL